ncbi:uncharacterized protein LOC110099169 [Dendrobium catenatum]|uniref:uncharacterized protein LOC110099169 n=1 Tax=Dendrobium catenatum TaxID=906689 RepID=UPI0009F43675|nr:uncharacterized protein LOC110099169 [Dendrobium catenatum]
MAPEDEKHTSFRTPISIFCYTVMSFGLKNAGATYQRAMTHIFDDLIHQKVECYVKDLVVKSMDQRNHLEDLRIVFERIRKFDLKMNPLKCAFGVSSSKFLGYVIHHRGIETDPNKIKAITEMPPPRNLRQLCSLQGQLAFIQRFISNLLIQKLRHYMLSHKITLISKIDPLKFLMIRPVLTDRLARWAVLLLQFDIIYMPQKVVKGQALADFLAAHPIPADSPLNDDLPDEQIIQVKEDEKLPFWEMYFNGASSIRTVRPPNFVRARAGIGLIFVAPEGGIMRISFSLIEPRTNNEAEYEALLAGLEIAIDVRIQHLQIFGDSQLVINQVIGIYKVSKVELTHYHRRALELLKQIPNVEIARVPQGKNTKADCLAKLAKEMANMNEESLIFIEVYTRRVLDPALLQFLRAEGILDSS